LYRTRSDGNADPDADAEANADAATNARANSATDVNANAATDADSNDNTDANTTHPANANAVNRVYYFRHSKLFDNLSGRKYVAAWNGSGVRRGESIFSDNNYRFRYQLLHGV
jgi:hypothetical protein